MRHIPTTPAAAEAFKRKAKKLQRAGGGKHADLLNRVAKGAGYDHWHHVTECLAASTKDEVVDGLLAECRRIVSAAHDRIDRLIVTGPELIAQPLILYSCQGDAWLLEPSDNFVLCLRFHGEEFPPTIGARSGQVEIAWDGAFALDGQAFFVDTGNPTVGTRTIHGYGLDELRSAIDKHQHFDARFASLFSQQDAEEITPGIIDRLVAEGWERERLEEYAREGLRYSTSRNTVITVPRSSFDDDE